MVSPFQNRTFSRLFTAQVVALAGTGLSTIALTLLSYDLAAGNAGIVLGAVFAIKMVAYVGIAPIIGGFVHRLPRRQFLIALDIARAGFVACLPLVTEIWHVYLLIFLLNACSAGFTPTFQATIPDVLTDEAQYTRALSLSRLAYDMENLLSPMLAAGALIVLSYDTLFALNAIAFLVSAYMVGSVRLPPPQHSERVTRDSIWSNISFGVASYVKTPRLRGVLALSVAVASAGAMVIVNTVVYVRDQLGGSESDTALAFAAAGAGSMVVALALPRLLDHVPDRPVMLAGGAVLTLGLFLGLTTPNFHALLLFWFILGAGSSLVQTPVGRLLRRSATASDRPAIFAAHFSLSHACWLIAYPLAGWIGSLAGLTITFATLGSVSLISTIIAFVLWPVRELSEEEHQHESMEHEHLHIHDAHHQHEHSKSEQSGEPHSHRHKHQPIRHIHSYVTDIHHPM